MQSKIESLWWLSLHLFLLGYGKMSGVLFGLCEPYVQTGNIINDSVRKIIRQKERIDRRTIRSVKLNLKIPNVTYRIPISCDESFTSYWAVQYNSLIVTSPIFRVCKTPIELSNGEIRGHRPSSLLIDPSWKFFSADYWRCNHKSQVNKIIRTKHRFKVLSSYALPVQVCCASVRYAKKVSKITCSSS